MEQFEEGDLEAARETLQQVEHTELPPNQRVRLFRTLQEIDRQTAEAAEADEAEQADEAEAGEAGEGDDEAADDAEDADEAEEEVEWVAPSADELLAEARRLAGQNAEAASQLYRQVLADDEASDEQRAEARANLAQLRRQANRELTMAREQIDLAAQALDRGDYDEAIERLEQVQASGVSLGWFDEQRVERQMARAQREREAAQPVADEDAETDADAQADADAEDGDAEDADAQADADDADAEDTEAQADADADEPATDAAADADADADEDATAEADETDADADAQADADEDGDADAVRADLFERARSLRQQELLVEARRAEEEGNIELAIRRYEAARELAPDDEQVNGRLQALRARQARQLAPQEPIQRERVRRQLEAQAAIADVRSALNTAQDRLEAGNYTAARDAVDRARLILSQQEGALPPDQRDDLRASAEALAIQIDEERADAEARQQWEALQTEERERELSRIRAQREQREAIEERLEQAMELRLEMRYDAALEQVNRALAIDPNNIAAQVMKMGIEDAQLLTDYRETRQNRERDLAQQRALNLEASRPYADLVRYPHDWPELTVTRLEQMDETMGESEENQAARRALSQSLPVDFEANRLVNVIDYFRDATEVNFYVNWGALEMAGVDQDTPVSLQLTDVPAERALSLVLDQISDDDFMSVQYSVIDGIVHISSAEDLRRTTDTRVYDIRDLLVQVPNFDNAPQFDLESALGDDDGGGGRDGGGGGGGGRDGGGLFGGDEGDDEDDEVERADMIEEIEELIRTTVGELDDWEEMGDGGSSMQEYNGNLIVRTTPENHRNVVDLLTQLRETRAIQISVEARFLLVDQSFFENIGVDFDFGIDNPGGNFGPIRIGQDSSSIAGGVATEQTPSRFRGSGGLARPEGFNESTGFNRSGRSLDLGVSYLDDLEVNLLVTATQASQQSISLTAPRVTFHNGQQAFVIVAEQFAFVSELEPIPDAAGFQQELDVISSGVILDVQGTVSADRRYVTMTLQPNLAQVDDIRTITQLAAVELPGGGDDDDDDDGDEVAIISGVIEAPTLQLTQISTTVSVPDRGTLLIGGQRLVDEVEVEAGVPVLSKVPFVNRLFTNTSTAKDERTLLVLVKPTILIQDEQEESRYPGLLDDPASYDRRGEF